MSATERRGFLKQVALALWAMTTLVLLFCVFLLAREMVRRGQNPLPVIAQPAAAPERAEGQEAAAAPQRTEEVLLYFADPNGNYLTPEPRPVPFSDRTVENCRSALLALIKGPKNKETYYPILAETTTVRAVYLLEDGELVIDFSRELVMEHKHVQSASSEALLVYGVVQTLSQAVLKGANDVAVKSVQFLVEGARPHDSFPAHVDTSEPFAPDRRWLTAPTAQ